MTSQMLDFLMTIGKLKQLRRTGWLRYHIKDSESVADHMYRMSIMAFFMKSSSNNINRDRCIKMALVHDMAESIVGDITPYCGVSKEEKFQRERDAMCELQTLVDNVEVGKEMLTLWQEYESQTTPEAKMVKDLDRFDMVLQAYEYEKQESKPLHLQEFFDNTSDKIETPEVLQWLEELNKRRT